MLKGKFLVLDGPDGAGKSTQITLLKELLDAKSLSTTALRDPGGTVIGDQIRQILLNPDHAEMSVRTEALLYMASRAQLYSEKIAPALASQQCVLCDRWLSSTLAYQAVAGRIGTDAVLNIARASLERTWPDLTIIIDLPSEAGMDRLGPQRDRMEQKSANFHRRVRQAFLDLAQSSKDARFAVVDGAASPQEVHSRICDAINQAFTP
ncbi:MAG: dTMP kinase [Sedimentisphaerales bacterium]|nr:dTMP kinase [Sedimentisphaerales bacterium]